MHTDKTLDQLAEIITSALAEINRRDKAYTTAMMASRENGYKDQPKRQYIGHVALFDMLKEMSIYDDAMLPSFELQCEEMGVDEDGCEPDGYDYEAQVKDDYIFAQTGR